MSCSPRPVCKWKIDTSAWHWCACFHSPLTELCSWNWWQPLLQSLRELKSVNLNCPGSYSRDIAAILHHPLVAGRCYQSGTCCPAYHVQSIITWPLTKRSPLLSVSHLALLRLLHRRGPAGRRGRGRRGRRRRRSWMGKWQRCAPALPLDAATCRGSRRRQPRPAARSPPLVSLRDCSGFKTVRDMQLLCFVQNTLCP